MSWSNEARVFEAQARENWRFYLYYKRLSAQMFTAAVYGIPAALIVGYWLATR